MKNKDMLVFLLVCTVLTLTGCSQVQPESVELNSEQIGNIEAVKIPSEATGLSTERIAQIEAEETLPESPGEHGYIYKDMNEMAATAKYIAELEILETEYFDHGITHTVSKAKVLSVQKGDIKEGDIIEIIEPGGNSKEFGDNSMGAPYSKLGDHIFIFLDFLTLENEKEIQGAEEFYKALGREEIFSRLSDLQSRFVVREGYVFQQSPEYFKFADYKSMTVDEFRAESAAAVRGESNVAMPAEEDIINLEKALINAVVEAREQSGLTQKQLSDLCGIKQPVIARLESAAHSPQINSMLRLLKPLGYTLAVVKEQPGQE